jgi:hypothetical protein
LLRADYALAGLVDSGQTRSLAARGGIIRGSLSGNGHLQARLRRPDGSRKAEQVHRLVAAAFLGPISAGCEVNHKNGNKSDNRVANLEYVSHRENMTHAAQKLGRMARKGSANGRALIDEASAAEIRTESAAGVSRKELCARRGLPKAAVDQLLSGRTWKHVA